MVYKPLTRNTNALKTKSPEEMKTFGTLSELIAGTTERIHIIYDDSGSMSNSIMMPDQTYKTTQELAADATTDYMKNCAPHTTAINIAPLNAEELSLTTNLPLLATKVKKLEPCGGTPLYHALFKLIEKQEKSKFTRALVFTDGCPTDEGVLYNHPNFNEELKALGIPIDFIIISDTPYLAASQEELEKLAKLTDGVFMVCKDGKAFKEKMKYFAPLLRYMLPSVTSNS